MNFLSVKGVVLGGALLAFTMPSHAVVLKQKWQAGQKLTYALTLDGTASVQLPPDAPGMALFAGVPLDVQMRGDGKAALDTLKVDEAGTGTVAVSVPQMKMNVGVMGQKALITLQNGKSQLLLNNQPIDLGFLPQGDGKPKNAVRVSTSGQFQGIEPIKDPTKPAPAPAKADQKPVPAGQAVDQTALIMATLIKTLPALWPQRDVKVGDTWQANVDFPALARPAEDGAPAKPLGVYDLKLEGDEVVDGKTLQRVTIKGDIDVLGKTLEAAFPAPPPAPAGNKDKARTMPRPQLEHASQSVEGTLWFDANAGQIQRANLILGGQAQGSTPRPNGQPGGKGWIDFTGTLNMNLQP